MCYTTLFAHFPSKLDSFESAQKKSQKHVSMLLRLPLYIFIYMLMLYASSEEFDMRYDLMNPSILPSITPPTSEVWWPVR